MPPANLLEHILHVYYDLIPICLNSTENNKSVS